mmetsp:Transcript_12669/g.21371  ORF Transcript_12669/g.21371 Transcript_12669/m.21371 type:complete len:80 (+) Transcript_12669:2376-2615(+)
MSAVTSTNGSRVLIALVLKKEEANEDSDIGEVTSEMILEEREDGVPMCADPGMPLRRIHAPIPRAAIAISERSRGSSPV